MLKYKERQRKKNEVKGERRGINKTRERKLRERKKCKKKKAHRQIMNGENNIKERWLTEMQGKSRKKKIKKDEKDEE